MPGDPSALLERLARLVQNDAHAEGLKPTQWEALRFLARANRFSRSPGALTAYLGTTKGTVSQTLRALERKALIEKRPVEGDRRGVRLELTPAGEALLQRDPLSELRTSLADLTIAERDVLGSSLEDLLRDMLARRGHRPFGQCRTCRYFNPTHEGGAPYFCGLLEEPLSGPDSEKICAEQTPA